METMTTQELCEQADRLASFSRTLAESNLQAAWRIFRREYGSQAAMECIAQECHSLASESGSSNQQERYEVAAIIEGAAAQLERYD